MSVSAVAKEMYGRMNSAELRIVPIKGYKATKRRKLEYIRRRNEVEDNVLSSRLKTMVVIDKIKFLTTIEKLEAVDIQQLANYLGMKYWTAQKRLLRYRQRGWVEYLKVGDDRKSFSPAGAKYLDYLRKRREDSNDKGY